MMPSGVHPPLVPGLVVQQTDILQAAVLAGVQGSPHAGGTRGGWLTLLSGEEEGQVRGGLEMCVECVALLLTPSKSE